MRLCLMEFAPIERFIFQKKVLTFYYDIKDKKLQQKNMNK